jgi:methyltransferase (TIGR00027 family)
VLSRLAPGTRVGTHCAPSNHRLTCHLGVVVPAADGGGKGECRIRVGDAWRGWEVGECLVFDDSFEHEVVNTTSGERVVLLIRFWHPDLGDDRGARRDAIERASRERGDAARARWVTPLAAGQADLERMLPFDAGGTGCGACGGGGGVELSVEQERKGGTPRLKASCGKCGEDLCPPNPLLEAAAATAVQSQITQAAPSPSPPVRAASKTAIGVALQRALHMTQDGEPKVLFDPIAPLLFSPEELSRAASADSPGTRLLRTHVVARSRYAEERLEAAVKQRGVRRCVVLGAGLDTFAYRQPSWALEELEILEVDHPASQADKLARLAAIGLTPPSNVKYVPVDFATTTLEEGLKGHVNRDSPTFFIWLGVIMYLDAAAIRRVLDFVASFPKRSELVFSFAPVTSQAVFSTEGLSSSEASAITNIPQKTTPTTAIEAQAAAAGEPWLSKHRPEDLADELRAAGFAEVEMLLPEGVVPWLGAEPRKDGIRPSDRITIGTALV